MQRQFEPEYGNAVEVDIKQPGPALLQIDFNEKEDIGRFLVEILLYVSIAGRAFPQLGILAVPMLSGAIILFSGITCLGIMLTKQQKIPVSFYFALGVNFLANFSQVLAVGQPPIFGDYLRDLLFWMCLLLMACYVIRNDSAARRVAIVLGAMVLAAVWIGGLGAVAGTVGAQVERLKLSRLGTMFANPNDLAYLTATLGITLLFFSLTSRKVFKPIYWLLALAMVVTLGRTVSRGGMLFFAIGAIFFLLSTVFGKGGKIGLVMLALLAVCAAVRFAYEYSETKQAYMYRMYMYSPRPAAWMSMPGDMKDTIIFGRGPAEARTMRRNVEPHNTFFWLHLAFGGPCAWTYLAWIALICARGIRMLRSPLVSRREKMEALGIFSVAMGCQIMSNFGPDNYGAILGMAVVEKYTAPFSRKMIANREMMLEQYYVDTEQQFAPELV